MDNTATRDLQIFIGRASDEYPSSDMGIPSLIVGGVARDDGRVRASRENYSLENGEESQRIGYIAIANSEVRPPGHTVQK
jgi:hypothetical protein